VLRSCPAWQRRCGGWVRSGSRSNSGSGHTPDSGGSPILPRPPPSRFNSAWSTTPTLATMPPPGGWRAARLVYEHALEPLRGWVLIARATEAADPGQHEALARQAHRLGQTSGDRHLELCALTQIGVALIDQGRITEGMTFHDEAMASALAGEGELDTVVFTACEMMDSYSRCAQYQRMAQWIHAADRFVERYGCPYPSMIPPTSSALTTT
jgi:hypothetical protein